MKTTGGMAASAQQRRKVRDLACVVCWKAPCDPAHLIPRSLWPDHDGDPRRVVPLCRRHHDEYDFGFLDLLPHLKGHRAELDYAIERFGLVPTLQRVRHERWHPALDPSILDREALEAMLP
jgi:hypothetical protein